MTAPPRRPRTFGDRISDLVREMADRDLVMLLATARLDGLAGFYVGLMEAEAVRRGLWA